MAPVRSLNLRPELLPRSTPASITLALSFLRSFKSLITMSNVYWVEYVSQLMGVSTRRKYQLETYQHVEVMARHPPFLANSVASCLRLHVIKEESVRNRLNPLPRPITHLIMHLRVEPSIMQRMNQSLSFCCPNEFNSISPVEKYNVWCLSYIETCPAAWNRGQ